MKQPISPDGPVPWERELLVFKADYGQLLIVDREKKKVLIKVVLALVYSILCGWLYRVSI